MTIFATGSAPVGAIGPNGGGFLTALRGPDSVSEPKRVYRQDTTLSLSQGVVTEGPAALMANPEATAVLIVAYHNTADMVGCLASLCHARTTPAFEIFVCENGGKEAYRSLIAALTAKGGPCLDTDWEETLETPLLVTRHVLRLKGGPNAALVHLGEARENLGYAGGVNAWLRPLMVAPGWPAVWVLNPDTQPAPDALSELAAYADRWGKGMVGSRLVPSAQPDCVHSRGLFWSKGRAIARSVDLRASGDVEPDPQEVDSRLDAPSGASMYVTRPCIERTGLMDERYFLFFEDLEWGLRAKREFGVGYAHRSVVVHAGGTTTGSSIRTARRSALAIYLEYRNSILFVRENFPNWLFWTLMVQCLRLLLKSRGRSFGTALRGIVAGVRGQTGSPDRILRSHNNAKGWGS